MRRGRDHLHARLARERRNATVAVARCPEDLDRLKLPVTRTPNPGSIVAPPHGPTPKLHTTHTHPLLVVAPKANRLPVPHVVTARRRRPRLAAHAAGSASRTCSSPNGLARDGGGGCWGREGPLLVDRGMAESGPVTSVLARHAATLQSYSSCPFARLHEWASSKHRVSVDQRRAADAQCIVLARAADRVANIGRCTG